LLVFYALQKLVIHMDKFSMEWSLARAGRNLTLLKWFSDER